MVSVQYEFIPRMSLWAVNLGEDADTVAAVAGSLAGLYYGYDNIPHEWLAGLKNKENDRACVRLGRILKTA